MSYEFTPDKDYSSNYLGTWPKLLAEYVGKPGLRFLEIGSCEGRSAIWLLDNVLTGDDSNLTCVDTWEDASVFDRFKANVNRFGRRCFRHRMASVDFLAGAYSAMRHDHHRADDLTADLIYIDGSHLAPDVLSDAVLSWRLLKVGGMLIFDDYHWVSDDPKESGPGKAIDAFLGVMGDRCEVLEKRMQVAIRKLRT